MQARSVFHIFVSVRYNAPYKTTDKKCIKRDNIFRYLTNKHKSGVYDDAQYLNAVIKANGDYDLPANVQGFIRRIDKDSD